MQASDRLKAALKAWAATKPNIMKGTLSAELLAAYEEQFQYDRSLWALCDAVVEAARDWDEYYFDGPMHKVKEVEMGLTRAVADLELAEKK
jgi:hypothetical protein